MSGRRNTVAHRQRLIKCPAGNIAALSAKVGLLCFVKDVEELRSLGKQHRSDQLPRVIEKFLNIGTFLCWRCKQEMKVSWVTIPDEFSFYGPEAFSGVEIEMARSMDALIKKVSSKTQGGAVCPSCDAFVGEFYIHDYLYQEENYVKFHSILKPQN